MGAPKGGGPEGWGAPKGGGPEGWGAQNFALFPFRLPQCSFFLPSLGGRRGASKTARELQTCTFQGSRNSKTPQKFHERTAKRGTKNENCGGRGEKKREILGGPPEGGLGWGPRRVVPRFRVQVFECLVFRLGVCVWWRKSGQNTEKNKLGQSRVGQSR